MKLNPIKIISRDKSATSQVKDSSKIIQDYTKIAPTISKNPSSIQEIPVTKISISDISQHTKKLESFLNCSKVTTSNEPFTLVDDKFAWIENGLENFQNINEHFNVIGLIGYDQSMQTLVSKLLLHLSNDKGFSNRTTNNYQNEAAIECSITSDRFIILSCQALNTVLFDHDIKYLKKTNCPLIQSEIQSIFLCSFLYSVCDHVFVFIDDSNDLSSLFSILEISHSTKYSNPTNLPSLNTSPQIERTPLLHFFVRKTTNIPYSCTNEEYVSFLFGNDLKSFDFYNNPAHESSSQIFVLDTLFEDQQDDSNNEDLLKIFGQLRNYLLLNDINCKNVHKLTETKWFHFAGRIWQSLKKSTKIMDCLEIFMKNNSI